MTPTWRILPVVFCAVVAGALAAPAARAGLVPAAGSPYPAGSATFAVAVGDFNGDGRPDLAAPAEDSDDVTVLLGQAGGGYAAAPGSPFPVGQRPADAAAADFDGDGRSDLAVANFGRTGDGDTITVLLGQPDGRLVPESDTTIGVGTGPTSVATANLDGDGRPDLVVTNQQSNSVTILLRRPGGGFTEEPGSPVTVGSAPFETAVGEFNGDGRPDLAVTNQFSGDVSILLRQPGGGFAPAAGSPLAAGSQPLGIASADFDGDGAADLAFANFQSDSVSVYLGHGDGSFTLEAGAPMHTGDGTYGVAAADFDADGRPDLAVSDQFDDEIAILTRKPSGSFAIDERVPAAKNPVRLAAGDLDGDGRADIAAAAFASSQVLVFHNPPKPPPPPPAPSPPVNFARPAIVQADQSEFIPGGSGPIAHLYHCLPGTWINRDPAQPYQFTWQRLTSDPALVSGYRVDTVATGEYFRASAATHQQLVGLSWRFQCVVRAAGAGGSASATSPSALLDPALDETPLNPRFGNVRIRGIDVFQVVQPNARMRMWEYPGLNPFGVACGGGTPTSWVPINGVCGLAAEPAQSKHYAGVDLDRGKPTTAIVYVDMDGTPAAQPEQQLNVTLRVRVNDKPYGRPQQQTVPAPPPSTTPYVTAAERANPAYGVQFELPPTLLCCTADKRVDVKATVELAHGFGPRPHQCDAGCTGDDHFTLWDLPLVTVPPIWVESVELRKAADDWNTAPNTLLQRAKQIYPGGERWFVFPSGAFININDIVVDWTINSPQCAPWKPSNDLQGCRRSAINARLGTWEARNRATTSLRDVLLGIHANDGAGDWKAGGTGTLEEPVDFWHPTAIINNGDLNRPLTSAAHELGHAIGLDHAGTSAGLFNTSCNGDTNGQVGEPWPQDQAGRLQGTKFDHTSGAPVTPQVDDNGPARLFDLMSYCQVANNAADPIHWLSARNWAHTIAALRTWEHKTAAITSASTRERTGASAGSAGRHATAAVAGHVAFAVGVIGPAGGRIERVVPHAGSSQPPPTAPGSTLRLRSLDAAGRLLADVGIRPDAFATHDPSTGASFATPVPPGAAAVELTRDGQLLDRLQRSASPPRVRLLSPRPGQRVRHGHARRLTVRWAARDRDHDPLDATVDYSPDGGRTWTTLYQGPSHGRAFIPARSLAGSRGARIRVGVNDGFNEPHTTSRRFRVDGNPPTARIIHPQGHESLLGNGRILLAGTALDDRHHELPARALTWYAGRKRLGRGRTLTVRLPAGGHTLRLVAHDAGGRTGVARQPLYVRRPPLRLTHLAYPHTVTRSAHSVTIRIAASERAILHAAHRRYHVGTRMARIILPLPRLPRTGVLRIRCALLAGHGRSRRGTIVLERR